MQLLAIAGIWIFGSSLIYLIKTPAKEKYKIMSCRRNLKTIKKVDESDAKSIF